VHDERRFHAVEQRGHLRAIAQFDGRNIYDPEAFGAAGLVYEGIGRRSGKAA
jgi:UDPglucose 6-dehydrogenase